MQNFRDLPINRKLMLIIMLTSTAALLLACTAFVIYDIKTFRDAMVDELSSLAEIVGANSTAALTFDDQGAAEEILASLRAKPHIVFACIFAADGSLFAKYHNREAYEDFSPPEVQDEGHYFQTDALVLFQGIDLAGEKVGTVYLRSDMQRLYSRLKRYAGIGGLVILASSLVALLISSKLQGVISSPILELARTARTISVEKNYSVRATQHAQDEVGLLIEAFNEMLTQIQARDTDLQEARDKLEERVVERTRELQEAEEKFRGIFENVLEGIYQTTPEGRFLSANPSLAQIHGYDSPEELISDLTNIQREVYVNPERREEFRRRIEAEGLLSGFVSQIRRKDGSVRWISESARTVLSDDGNIAFYEGTIQDITVRREAEEEVRKSRDELEEANQTLKQNQAFLVQSEKMAGLGQLSAGVAHEINTPVGFVLSNVRSMGKYVEKFKTLFQSYDDLLEAARLRDASKLKQAVEEVVETKKLTKLDFILEDVDILLSETDEGLERIRRIVENLRSFARPEEADAKEADINEGIESTLGLVLNELKYKCEIKKELGDLPPVFCHPSELNQVFMNLLVNAGQAIEDRGEIAIKTGLDNGHIVVKISDTGSGIPPENLSKLFEPFFTTKPVGQGTGLGLAICHGIIQKHQGTIDVESEVGKGTTFTIKIPASGLRDE